MGESNFNRGQFTIAGFSYTGSSDPSDANGLDGDYYYKWDGSSMSIFGPKTSGAWGSGSALGGGVSFDGLSAQTPPLPALSEFIVSVPRAGFTISGTGIVDGEYVEYDTYHSKLRYTISGYEGTTEASIYWNSTLSIWVISNTSDIVQYYSADAVATPDLVTTWVNVSTLTGSGAGTFVTNTTYNFTVFDSSHPVYSSPTTVAEIRYGGGHNGHAYYHIRRKGVGQYYYYSDNVNDPINAVWTADTNGTNPGPTLVHASSSLPTLTAFLPETLTIEWGQLIDADPTFAANSDLIVPTQKAVNTKTTALEAEITALSTALTPMTRTLFGVSTVDDTSEPLDFSLDAPSQGGVGYLVDIYVSIFSDPLTDPESYVSLLIGTVGSLGFSIQYIGPIINWSDLSINPGARLSYGSALFGPFTSNAGIGGRAFVQGDGTLFRVAVFSHLHTDTVYPTLQGRVTFIPTTNS